MSGVKSESGETRVIAKLQYALATYDKILFIQDAEDFGKCLESVKAVKDGRLNISPDKKVLLLVKDPYPACCMEFAQMVLTEEEWETIYCLYYMYEFSNRFRMVTKDAMYGNIFELVKNGLITYEEALEAILR